MDEIDALIDAYSKGLKKNQGMVLATLIRVEGSHYRRMGAKVLFTHERPVAGTISGGCMERDLQTYVKTVLKDKQPRIITYDTTTEEDLLWGLNLGCGGRVEVFLESLVPDDPGNPLDFVQRCRRDQREGAVATIVATAPELKSELGKHVFYSPRDSLKGNALSGDLQTEIDQEVKTVLAQRKSKLLDYTIPEGKVTVWCDYIPLPTQILVCGAGEDARPLVQLMADMGWRVFLSDPRPAVVEDEAFPGVHDFVIAPFEELPRHIDFDHLNGVVILTHNYQNDLQLLDIFFASSIPYIGLLGSRKRTKRLLVDLARRRGTITPQQRSRLHAPVGLDLQAESPQEIALAIVAEILSVLKQGSN